MPKILMLASVFMMTALQSTLLFGQTPTFMQRELTRSNRLEILFGPLGNAGPGGVVLKKSVNSTNIPDASVPANETLSADVAFTLAYGISDDFLLAVKMEQDTRTLALSGRYRLSADKLELATQLELIQPISIFPTFPSVALTFPLRYHGLLRVDISPKISFAFIYHVSDDMVSFEPYFQTRIPVQSFYQISNSTFIGFITGVNFLSEPYRSRFSLPIGIEAGYTVESERQFFDFTCSFQFPSFYSRGKERVKETHKGSVVAYRDREFSELTLSTWQVSAGINFHLD